MTGPILATILLCIYAGVSLNLVIRHRRLAYATDPNTNTNTATQRSHPWPPPMKS